MIDEVSYHVFIGDRDTGDRRNCVRCMVHGTQVGRFAVRTGLEGKPKTPVVPGGRLMRAVRPYVVDHIGSGLMLSDFTRFEDAMMVADELSRFAKSDPASRHRPRVVQQIGPDLIDWLLLCRQYDKATPYRPWLELRAVLGPHPP